MTQFSNICGASPVNNNIIFFDGHGSNFDDCTLRHMEHQNIQPFLPKSGNSINNQNNDNGPDTKMMSLYNQEKSEWMLKYWTTIMLPHHMNSILVGAWDALKMSYGKVIRYRFSKTKLHPLSPPESTTNIQSCADFFREPSGSNSDKTNEISHRTVASIEVEYTNTDDPMVVL